MGLTLNQALQKGIEAHKAGLIQEADQYYTAILQSHPKHPDANHNMGVLAVGINKAQEALPFFKTAVEANPSVIQFWLSYIEVLIRLDKIPDATAAFNQAKDKGIRGDGFDQLERRMNEIDGNTRDAYLGGSGTSGGKSNILDILTLDQAVKLARKKLKSGFSEEAKNLYEDILARFPRNKKAIDGEKNISDRTNGATSKSQEPTPELLQPLINLYSQGQLHQALSHASQMRQKFPNSVVLCNILGATNSDLGDFDAALDYYREAINISPDYADSYYNMGNALKGQGNLNAAIDSYKKALKIKPSYSVAYNNMGIALGNNGELDAAIDSYKKALKINPDYAEAYSNIGLALEGKGELDAAIESYEQSLKINPDYAEAYSNMGLALTGHTFTKLVPGLQEIITSLLSRKNYSRPSDIAGAGISLLKFEPVIKEFSEKYSAGDLKRGLQETISELSELPLLLKLMSVCPLPDLELEVFLTDIRSSLLSSISKTSISPKFLRFQTALALQCFTNEYIYNQTAKEDEELEALNILVKKTLSNGTQPSPQSILCLASFKSLHDYDWTDSLVMTADIEEVFIRQILEPRQEGRLKTEIPILEEVLDTVSCKVREQYEENPYPRWVALGLRLKPVAISEMVNELKLNVFDNKVVNVESPNILVAGCGTGQQSIGTATTFQNSKVLAIDLSLASLAYAKRKTEELGIQNIDYMQSDILDLGKLDRQFDIIESGGVLHHMDDPISGWKVLAGCLKPGGLMRIGLYSERARQHIITAREEIIQTGFGSTDVAVRLFRNGVINSDREHHKKIVESRDFYSMSTVRDLLFHVQEYRFTLLQIQDSLSQLGLEFCGFEYNRIVKDFKRANTEPSDLYNLDKWHSYEEANPDIFVGMYQFWCQKAA